MQKTQYGHAMLLLTGLVSKLRFSPPPENAVWKRDQSVGTSVGACSLYLQVEVLVLVDRMAAEGSVATL